MKRLAQVFQVLPEGVPRMSEPNGLKALVTGGACGIGRATAELMAQRGADVAVLDFDPSPVGKPLRGYAADVSDDTAVRSAVAAAAGDLGGIDILVNNAGHRRSGHRRGQR